MLAQISGFVFLLAGIAFIHFGYYTIGGILLLIDLLLSVVYIFAKLTRALSSFKVFLYFCAFLFFFWTVIQNGDDISSVIRGEMNDVQGDVNPLDRTLNQTNSSNNTTKNTEESITGQFSFNLPFSS